MENPKIRPIEAIPLEISGRPMIAIRDPFQIANDTVFITEDLLFILQYFDGKHSVSDICQIYAQHFNTPIEQEQIDQIILELDQRLFLDSTFFRTHQEKSIQEYRKLSSRPAMFANQSYPGDPNILRQQLKQYFSVAEKKLNSTFSPVQLAQMRFKGIVVPHIDIQAGGPSFAVAYHLLEQAQPIDLFIILGTGHNGIQNEFTCTEKDFDSPLGSVKTDKNFLQTLQSKLKTDIFAEEILHKKEHTIEFQTTFLQYVFGNRKDWQIVPILCSFSPRMFRENWPEVENIHAFLHALKQTMIESDKRICIIASADLSHIGPRYGDSYQPDEKIIQELRQKDLQTLTYVEQLNLEQFVQSVAADETERKICGFPPIYSLLKLIDANQGKLLHYDRVSVDQSDSTVSFASLAFF